MPKLVKAWQCAACQQVSLHEETIIRHEAFCGHKNNGCSAGEHFRMGEIKCAIDLDTTSLQINCPKFKRCE